MEAILLLATAFVSIVSAVVMVVLLGVVFGVVKIDFTVHRDDR